MITPKDTKTKVFFIDAHRKINLMQWAYRRYTNDIIPDTQPRRHQSDSSQGPVASPDESRLFEPYIPSAENPSGQNAGHICNERMDELWNALFVTMDPAERQAQAHEIQYIMVDEALTLYLLETAQSLS